MSRADVNVDIDIMCVNVYIDVMRVNVYIDVKSLTLICTSSPIYLHVHTNVTTAVLRAWGSAMRSNSAMARSWARFRVVPPRRRKCGCTLCPGCLTGRKF